MNYVAGQKDVIDAFRCGRDIYCEIASDIYKRQITKSDTSERFFGKKTELSCGYGIGANTIYLRLKGEGVDLVEQNSDKHSSLVQRRLRHGVGKARKKLLFQLAQTTHLHLQGKAAPDTKSDRAHNLFLKAKEVSPPLLSLFGGLGQTLDRPISRVHDSIEPREPFFNQGDVRRRVPWFCRRLLEQGCKVFRLF